MDPAYAWRGEFSSRAVDVLHAEAFRTQVFSDTEWDWERLVATHSPRRQRPGRRLRVLRP